MQDINSSSSWITWNYAFVRKGIRFGQNRLTVTSVHTWWAGTL